MTTLPQTGATELTSGQATPETTVNEALRLLDAGFARSVIEDRDLTAPPGTCADGARYLVAASPTGLWAGQAGKLAVAMGTNAANGWDFVTIAREGFKLYVRDEDKEILYNGSAWVDQSAYTAENARDDIGAALVAGTGIAIAVSDPSDTITISQGAFTVSTQTGTSYTTVLADAQTYVRFTNGSAITLTIPPNSSVAYPVGTRITFEQGGAGVFTLTPGAGVTLNSRGALLSSAGQFAVVQVQKVATDTWTVIGDVA